MKNLNVAGRRVPPSQSYSIGTKIGWWTVLQNDVQKPEGDRIRAACRVRCRCGKDFIVSMTTLRQGRSTRCKYCAWAATYIKKREHCAKAHPAISIGAKFGYWTVIESGLRVENIRAVRVRCECGTEKVKGYFTLRNGTSTSCGCRRKPSIDGTWSSIYANIARRSGIACHLTRPQIKAICQLNCAYCGIEPSNVMRRKIGSECQHVPSLDVCYSGIDRLDSGIGYVPGNVVPCCARCNIAKSTLSVEDFVAMLHRIQAHNPTVAGIRELAERLSR